MTILNNLQIRFCSYLFVMQQQISGFQTIRPYAEIVIQKNEAKNADLGILQTYQFSPIREVYFLASEITVTTEAGLA
jgi:hypothetical protein